MGKGTKQRTVKQLANDERLRAAAAERHRPDTSERVTRAQSLRASEPEHEVSDTPWVQGGSLTAPAPRPGYTQRWIRISTKGKDDGINVSRKFREGWKPRRGDTVPKTWETAKMEQGKFAGCIVVESMLLCEMPVELAKKRKIFMRDQTNKKTQAIDAEIQRANDANRSAGFGDIRKSERSIPVREVKVQREASTADD